jgi:hypothetical protein
MDKLWKGIFYCELQSPNDMKKILMTVFQGVWMSDRTLVQQALASELANILLSIDHSTASFEYLGGFWRTIVREWEGIDYLRWAPVDFPPTLRISTHNPRQNEQILHAYPALC